MLLRFRFVYTLLIAATVAACSSPDKHPKADTRPGQSSPVESMSPLTILMREAQAGNAKAQHTLAVKYLRGEGVAKDLAKSVEWEQKSAGQGYAEAQAQLADDYANGWGVVFNPTTATRWAEKAAVQGNAEGQWLLAASYSSGTSGVIKDDAKASGLLQKAASKGNAQAQLALSYRYAAGTGVPKDMVKSVEWLQKAATQENARAQWTLSVCYARGNGCPKDSAKAAEWYQKAWAQDDAQGLFSIGDAIGAQDPAKAMEWRQHAAAQGDADVERQLGDCYQMNPDSGRIWGCVRDLAKAVEWHEKAAAQGDATAIDSLAEAYDKGTGVVKDPAKAVQLWRQAAVRGDAVAIDALGTAYDEGNGVIKDSAKAVELWRQAATKGYQPAFTDLYEFYFRKAIAAQSRHDLVLAYAWANIAAGQDDPSAQRDVSSRDIFENKLTQAEIAEGQRLAASWKPGIKPPQTPNQPDAAPQNIAAQPTKQATGTMFVVDQTGLAVTNEHVVHGCREMRLDGHEGNLKIVAVDAANDLALIQLPDHPNAAAIIDGTDKRRQGDDITVFGFPLNGLLASGGNLTTGVMSGLTGMHNNSTQFQFTAAIQPGSSGSPVMNDRGDVIGVVSSKLSDEAMAKATGSLGENLNFAISGQELRAFLDANRVAYASDTGGWFSRKKSPADIADTARKWTLMVECWR